MLTLETAIGTLADVDAAPKFGAPVAANAATRLTVVARPRRG